MMSFVQVNFFRCRICSSHSMSYSMSYLSYMLYMLTSFKCFDCAGHHFFLCTPVNTALTRKLGQSFSLCQYFSCAPVLLPSTPCGTTSGPGHSKTPSRAATRVSIPFFLRSGAYILSIAMTCRRWSWCCLRRCWPSRERAKFRSCKFRGSVDPVPPPALDEDG